MTFAELVAAIVMETKRGDLGFINDGGDGTIPLKVKSALLWAHSLEAFNQDLELAQVVFDSSSYIQQLDTLSLVRYRECAFIRKDPPATFTNAVVANNLPALIDWMWSQGIQSAQKASGYLEVIKNLKDSYDEYGDSKSDIAYQAGSSLFMKSSTPMDKIMLGWYAFPVLSITDTTTTYDESNFNSWIARDYPFLVIYHACSSVFSTTGKQEQARKLDAPAAQGGLVAQQIQALITNAFSTVNG